MMTKERIVEINNRAQENYLAWRASTSQAQCYLEKRGIPLDVANEFGIGFAPASGNVVDRIDHSLYSTVELMHAGIANDKGRDRFRNRLMFPIHDDIGSLVGFAGRAMEDDQIPKYLNSPETAAYSKRKILYGLNLAGQHIGRDGYAILVEGQMDVIGLHGAGFKQAVASCGTSLTSDHALLLSRYTGLVFINFDSDDAGIKAANRSARELMNGGLEVRIVTLHGAKDPDEYTKKFGNAAYFDALNKAKTYLEWAVGVCRDRYDLDTIEGRAKCLEWILPIFASCAKKADQVSAFRLVGEALGLPAKAIYNALAKDNEPGVITYDQRDLGEALSLASKLP